MRLQEEESAMGVRMVLIIPLLLVGLWDLYTTFRGVADFFDLPTNPYINEGQFAFGVVITLTVFGFVIGSQLFWNANLHDAPALLLKAAWATCVGIDLYTAWAGTKRVVFYDDDDPAKAFGIAVAAALIVASTILLSKVLLDKDFRKAFT
jgi:hypothetical protein